MTTAKQKLQQTREKYPKREDSPAARKVTAKQKLAMNKPKKGKGFGDLDEYM